MNRRLQSIRGFTLLEMMVVVAIIGILVTIAIPNFLQGVRKYKLKAAVGELHGNLGLARMAAINQNTTVTVTVCPGGCPTPAPVTVSFQTGAGANVLNVLPPMTLDPQVALTNVLGTAGVVGPQVLQFNNRGTWAPGGGAICININGVGQACPGATGQALNFMNTDGVNYRIVVSSTGKTSWCYSANCAQ